MDIISFILHYNLFRISIYRSGKWRSEGYNNLSKAMELVCDWVVISAEHHICILQEGARDEIWEKVSQRKRKDRTGKWRGERKVPSIPGCNDYICFLLPHNKLLQTLLLKIAYIYFHFFNSVHLLSHCFHRSEVQAQFCWVLCFKVPTNALLRVLAGCNPEVGRGYGLSLWASTGNWNQENSIQTDKCVEIDTCEQTTV